ncbi:MAG: transposase [Sulfurovum sp.]|nr:transposase [Sulfurovum sp.]
MKKSKKKKDAKVGRPKGSGNQDKKDIELSPYLKFVQESVNKALKRIDKHIDIVYFVFDGAFGNNPAVQMVRQCGLHIISKLQKKILHCYFLIVESIQEEELLGNMEMLLTMITFQKTI